MIFKKIRKKEQTLILVKSMFVQLQEQKKVLSGLQRGYTSAYNRIFETTHFLEKIHDIIAKVESVFVERSLPSTLYHILEAQKMQREAFKLLSEWIYWDMSHSTHWKRDDLAAIWQRAHMLKSYFENTDERMNKLMEGIY